MSMISHSLTNKESSASLFLQLINGSYIPNKLWCCKRFRAKFVLRTLVYPLTTINYLNKLSQLDDFEHVIGVQGLLPAKLHRPYLQSGFSVAQRAQAILDHYQIMAQLSDAILRQRLMSPGDNLLAEFKGKNDEDFLIHCCPGRFDREGEITLELHYQSCLIASLSFSVINQNNQRTVLIGGLQGPRKTIGSDITRDATKAAHGLFPKRLLMETLFILAQQCDARAILAVGDDTHVFRSLRYRHSKGDHFFASYSEFWSSIGGELRKDGLFQLPMAMERKSLEEIASKKRAEYRRRYALMDTLTEQVSVNTGEEKDVQTAA